ncbi:hypothetical protein [Ligilactobacillus agilis]|uniref:hypothetical protein n=1 Tax=Ligilactobacillus agilis TaxID=1601 RepID=UPI0024319F47|nr:hypothetical protein [Ligilactobacillus agilis]
MSLYQLYAGCFFFVEEVDKTSFQYLLYLRLPYYLADKIRLDLADENLLPALNYSFDYQLNSKHDRFTQLLAHIHLNHHDFTLDLLKMPELCFITKHRCKEVKVTDEDSEYFGQVMQEALPDPEAVYLDPNEIAYKLTPEDMPLVEWTLNFEPLDTYEELINYYHNDN